MVDHLHPPLRSQFATSSPEESRAMMAAAYADTSLQVSGDVESYRLAQSRVDLGQVRLDTYQHTLASAYTMRPLGYLAIARVLAGGLRLNSAHLEHTVGPGDVLLAAQPDEEHTSNTEGVRMTVVSIDLPLVASVTDDPVDRIRRCRADPLDPRSAADWLRAVGYLDETLLGGDPVARSPLVLGAAGRLLAATFLTVFDRDPGADRVVDRADATPAALRRAIAFMEANPDLDIGVVDIARAAHVSVRSLQLAFRRHRDTTPMTYLRRVRLDRARADLVESHPGAGTTVTAIAARWGFARPSRFSAEYRSVYAEAPRDTLRR